MTGTSTQHNPDFDPATTSVDLSSTVVGQLDRLRGRVLLVGLDGTAVDWARKWMKHANLQTVFADTRSDALTACLGHRPDVLVVDASSSDDNGIPLFQTLTTDPGFRDVPMIVLCPSTRDAEMALDAGAADVVRKPIDWQLASRRASTLARLADKEAETDVLRDALRRSESQVENSRRYVSALSDTDSLTGLPSLAKFRQLLARALCQSDELGLFLIGLERFHLINEAHGRDVGDRVLELMGARLRDALVRPELHAPGRNSFLAACVAKLDGVRFGLFIPYDGGPSHLKTIRQVLTDVCAEPLDIEGRTIYLSSSIGGAVSPRDGSSASELVQNADRAMMTVKHRGGGFSMHSPDGGISSARLLELDRWLREAVATDQLQVAYQPLVNLWNDRIVGAEALLRWNREPEGFISPAEFIPVAEHSGIIVQIGDFVIDQACRQLRAWMDDGFPQQRMAINLSLIQLRRGDVRRSVEAALSRYDLRPAQLELEISERGAIGDDQRVVRQLHEIKSLGVRLSLDDFGTGDTAIEYLKRLPIDVLKLDRSYIAGALENGLDAVIASALVELAKRMNLTVIAEGVEVPEQRELLRTWGCHLYQGFLCSPAVSGSAFLELLHTNASENAQEFVS